jgi:hypothetical protein
MLNGYENVSKKSPLAVHRANAIVDDHQCANASRSSLSSGR